MTDNKEQHIDDNESFVNSLSKETQARLAQTAEKWAGFAALSEHENKRKSIGSILEKANIRTPKLRIPQLNRPSELKDIDVGQLKDLRKQIQNADVYSDSDEELYSKLEGALSKFIDCYETFEELNSSQYRQLSLKKAELELEHQNLEYKLLAQEAENRLKARYDWRDKWRHLFIKSLGTALFISLLLFVGWLVKNYEWAVLPYSSLFSNGIPMPKIM
ncbi:hypothetical protein VCSRO96_1346 [Vibrio cholerae]|uniref:hypothetical protein n=1 Tax=Vibrio cholerae TaxID=666 RepID=UPI00061567C9|nr:hypothetical protein [Vibrio cholerae]AKB03396.1 hypothetical protein VAA049_1316 [Vibrio cholerae]AKB04860.1 hypothetical protein VAA049_1324 [Vibrio cholerae]EGR2420532.1 hypothetical protein [Vibrio cholerae]EKF9248847.1 hypothetical protein [Vibrio cholerae]MDV2372978.1 hypothetical protein [Vibrio cholerae]